MTVRVGKSVIASLAVALMAVWYVTSGVAPAQAVGPFDGLWQGDSVTVWGRCEQHYRVEFSIRDGAVSGEMVANGERMTVATTVAADGRMGPVFAYNYNGRTLVKTAGQRLGAAEGRIRWTSQEPDYFGIRDVGDCAGVVTVRRVSDAPQ